MAFRKALGAVGTTAILAFTAIGAFSPAAYAADDASGQQATVQVRPVNSDPQASSLPSPTTAKVTDPKTTLPGAVSASTGSQKPNAVSCWNGSTNGRWFYETCEGQGYSVYVDCTNGYRYIWGQYSGQINFALECPAGSSAIWGGGIG